MISQIIIVHIDLNTFIRQDGLIIYMNQIMQGVLLGGLRKLRETLEVNQQNLNEVAAIFAASGQDLIVKMGDNAGANKVSFTDSDDGEVASIDSDGNAIFKGLAINNQGAGADPVFSANSAVQRTELAGQLYPSLGVRVNDSINIIFGSSSDAYIHYDDTNLVINPKSAGSGYVDIQGNLKTTEGIDVSGAYITNSHTEAGLSLASSSGRTYAVISGGGGNVSANYFAIRDITADSNRLYIDLAGVVTIDGNTNFGAGIDVTGYSHFISPVGIGVIGI